jgi:nucleoside-diphosphate-sugar epimerase
MTGSNGFIGSHVLEALLQKENMRVGITLRSNSEISRIKAILDVPGRIEKFILDDQTIDDIISSFKPKIIIHLAAFYEKNHVSGNVGQTINSNISFPTEILDSMTRNQVTFFINTGTFTEYLMDGALIDQKTALFPSNLYSATKIGFEDILRYFTEKRNINAVTLKLAATYGPRDNPRKLIPYLINCSINKKTAKITDGFQMWDYVFVRDVADSYIKTIEYLVNSREKYSVFNIGSGNTYSLREIAKNVEKIGGNFKIDWGGVPYGAQEVFYFKTDITRARNILKWWPQYSLKRGLLETYNYYRSFNRDE